jgi:hypothetical protein
MELSKGNLGILLAVCPVLRKNEYVPNLCHPRWLTSKQH